jgi:NAD(P)-dependent dehydrogenase (short-subunit alcohol dehydrogenase family)
VFAGVRSDKAAAELAVTGEGITPVIIDVTEPGSISSALAMVQQRLGPEGLTGLVNNAGELCCARPPHPAARPPSSALSASGPAQLGLRPLPRTRTLICPLAQLPAPRQQAQTSPPSPLRPHPTLPHSHNPPGKGVIGPLEHMPIGALADVMDVNLLGVVRVTQAFLPLIRQGSPGRIVNIGSQAGTISLPLFSPYSCSKFAVEALSDSLRCACLPRLTRLIPCLQGCWPAKGRGQVLRAGGPLRVGRQRARFCLGWRRVLDAGEGYGGARGSEVGSACRGPWLSAAASAAGSRRRHVARRYELQPQGIKVVLLKPGAVKTPIWDKSLEASEALVQGLPEEAKRLYATTIKQVGARCCSGCRRGGAGVAPTRLKG